MKNVATQITGQNTLQRQLTESQSGQKSLSIEGKTKLSASRLGSTKNFIKRVGHTVGSAVFRKPAAAAYQKLPDVVPSFDETKKAIINTQQETLESVSVGDCDEKNTESLMSNQEARVVMENMDQLEAYINSRKAANEARKAPCDAQSDQESSLSTIDDYFEALYDGLTLSGFYEELTVGGGHIDNWSLASVLEHTEPSILQSAIVTKASF